MTTTLPCLCWDHEWGCLARLAGGAISWGSPGGLFGEDLQWGSPVVHCAGCLQLSFPAADGIPMHIGVHPRALIPKVGCPAMLLGGRNYSSKYPPDLGEVGRWHHLHLAGMLAEKCSRFKNRFELLILGGRSGESHICVCWEKGRAGPAPAGSHLFCSQCLSSQGHPQGVSLWRGKERNVGVPAACACPAVTSLSGELMPREPRCSGCCPRSALCPVVVPRAGQGLQAGVTPSQ